VNLERKAVAFPSFRRLFWNDPSERQGQPVDGTFAQACCPCASLVKEAVLEERVRKTERLLQEEEKASSAF